MYHFLRESNPKYTENKDGVLLSASKHSLIWCFSLSAASNEAEISLCCVRNMLEEALSLMAVLVSICMPMASTSYVTPQMELRYYRDTRLRIYEMKF